MLLSLVYRLVKFQFGLLTVLIRSDLSMDVELLVLRHENQELRRQVERRSFRLPGHDCALAVGRLSRRQTSGALTAASIY